MKAFSFVRPRTLSEAAGALGAPGSVLKAGGVDLLDRLKERVDEPDRVVGLVDVAEQRAIARGADGAFTLGALVTLQQLSEHPELAQSLPTLARAAGLAASPQLRRRATLGGNLGQHTRCGYYRHLSFPCVKRGASACPVRAAGGVQDAAGVFGNDLCASSHPSSVAPVLGSLDARVHVLAPQEPGRAAPQVLAFEALWAAPAAGRASDLALAPGQVISHVEIPAQGAAGFGYEEVRVKAAFDWALVSAAVRLQVEGGKVVSARVWLGSVAPVPWRAAAAEALLTGRGLPDAAAALAAGQAALQGATPLEGSAYKLPLITTAVKRAVLDAARRA